MTDVERPAQCRYFASVRAVRLRPCIRYGEQDDEKVDGLCGDGPILPALIVDLIWNRGLRGADVPETTLFSDVSVEDRIPVVHPLRTSTRWSIRSSPRRAAHHRGDWGADQ